MDIAIVIEYAKRAAFFKSDGSLYRMIAVQEEEGYFLYYDEDSGDEFQQPFIDVKETDQFFELTEIKQ